MDGQITYRWTFSSYLPVVLGLFLLAPSPSEAGNATMYNFVGKLCTQTKPTLQQENSNKGKCAIFCKKHQCGVFSVSNDNVCSLYPSPVNIIACPDEFASNKAAVFYFKAAQEDACSQTNVAIRKDAKQINGIGQGDAKYAVDGNQEYKDYNMFTCSQSGGAGNDHPWLRVDLIESYVVYKVILHNRGDGDPMIKRLHDLQIRVGDADFVYCDPGDGSNSRNAVCVESLNQFYPEGPTEFLCKKPLTGRFVSIQIIKMCDFDGCIDRDKNVLTLCEVVILGKLPSEADSDVIPEKDIIVKPVAVNFAAAIKECEGLLEGRLISIVNKKIQSKVEAAIRKSGNSEWLWIGLGGTGSPGNYQLKWFDGSVYNPSSSFNNFDTKYQQTGSICVAASGGSWAPFGKWVQLNCVNEKRAAVCEYLPESSAGIRDIARNMPVKQQDMQSPYPPYNAIDGLAPHNNAMTKQAYTVQCQATTPETYPWWRVDLGNPHKVVSITVFNVGGGNNGRLHDFVIRIGFVDIAAVPGVTIFDQNSVCYQLMNTILKEGKSQFDCRETIWGRFVSIQIVNLCTLSECKLKDKNILNLCEVEVNGYSPFDNFTTVSIKV